MRNWCKRNWNGHDRASMRLELLYVNVTRLIHPCSSTIRYDTCVWRTSEKNLWLDSTSWLVRSEGYYRSINIKDLPNEDPRPEKNRCFSFVMGPILTWWTLASQMPCFKCHRSRKPWRCLPHCQPIAYTWAVNILMTPALPRYCEPQYTIYKYHITLSRISQIRMRWAFSSIKHEHRRPVWKWGMTKKALVKFREFGWSNAVDTGNARNQLIRWIGLSFRMEL